MGRGRDHDVWNSLNKKLLSLNYFVYVTHNKSGGEGFTIKR